MEHFLRQLQEMFYSGNQEETTENANENTTETSEIPEESKESLWSPQDVRIIREALVTSIRPSLPMELIQQIMNEANIFACQPFTSDEPLVGSDLNEPYLSICFSEEQLQDLHRVVKMEFECQAHDQGWATDGGSWTWAELSIVPKTLKNLKEDTSTRHLLYRNPSAQWEWTMHRIEFNLQSDILHSFDPQQHQLVLWVRSQFPGWTHFIHQAQVKVFYQVS